MTARVAASRRLSYVLRHNPASIGVHLDAHGWISVADLLAALAAHGLVLTGEDLTDIVVTNDKQRFELVDGRIRAAQGHSLAVDLGLVVTQPPDFLWHGTVARFLASITADGLVPRGRQHVHLSPDPRTARAVGARRGEPVILRIDALALHRTGHQFFLAANGVWLTDHVPPAHLHREQ